jgi:hypothetical protein
VSPGPTRSGSSWTRSSSATTSPWRSVREVIDYYGDVIVRAKCDGTYDKTNLPAELVMTSYFGIRDGKITSLVVIFTQPSPY